MTEYHCNNTISDRTEHKAKEVIAIWHFECAALLDWFTIVTHCVIITFLFDYICVCDCNGIAFDEGGLHSSKEPLFNFDLVSVVEGNGLKQRTECSIVNVHRSWCDMCWCSKHLNQILYKMNLSKFYLWHCHSWRFTKRIERREGHFKVTRIQYELNRPYSQWIESNRIDSIIKYLHTLT